MRRHAFVIGGYSQGASSTDQATQVLPTLLGKTIPPALAPRIAAVVAFGNPSHLLFTNPTKASPTYGMKWDDYCASGDPICRSGLSMDAHVSYVDNGDTASAAMFAATKVLNAEG